MKEKGVSVVVTSIMLIAIAVVAAGVVYVVYSIMYVPYADTESILEDVKVIKLDVNNDTGDVSLFILNRGGVNSSVDIVYVENLWHSLIAVNYTFIGDNARNLGPGQAAEIKFNVQPTDILNQPLYFKVATRRGSYSNLMFMIPTSTYIENQTGGGGNVTITKFTISGIVFDDLDRDGSYSPFNDSLFPYYPVFLLDELGNRIAGPILTDQFGYYAFTNLDRGNFTVFCPNYPNYNASGSYYNTTSLEKGVIITVYNVTGINFGKAFYLFPPVFDISGRKYNDTNNNDRYDLNIDQPIAGWVITLRNAIGGPLFATKTAANGEYLFENVLEGSYIVEEALKPGSVYVGNTSYNINVDRDYANLNFLNKYYLDYVATGFSITGAKFNDVNKNGVWDINETGIPGWMITYRDLGTNRLYAVETNDTGHFNIIVPPGNYRVEEALMPGWESTTPRVYEVTITNQSISLSPFGNFFNASVIGNLRVGGMLYYDLDNDGIFDEGFDLPLEGWRVKLEGDNGIPIEAVTQANGSYVFSGLLPGHYVVTELLSPGWTYTTPYTMPVTLAYESNLSIDFGNKPIGPVATYSVSGYKFNDTNKNGQYDPGEPGVQGWQILLKDSRGATINATSTNSTGGYSFAGLVPGIYSIEEVMQTYWVNATPSVVNFFVTSADISINFTNTYLGANPTFNIGGIKFNDSNGNGIKDDDEGIIPDWAIFLRNSAGTIVNVTTTNATGWYMFYGLTNNTVWYVEESNPPGWVNTLPDTQMVRIINWNNYSINFGNRYVGFGSGTPLYTISGIKFNDTLVQNGERDPGEQALSGWTIVLSNATQIFGISVTNGSGYYSFVGLPAGSYTVTEMMKSNWFATVSSSYSVDLTDNATIDFANYYIPPGSTYNVGGIVYNDSNKNGRLDAGENGLADWTVVLKTGSGNTVSAVTTTNATGHYVFTGLTNGTTYYVEEALQVGWNNTDPVSTSRVQKSFILANANNYSVNFGNYFMSIPSPLYTISGIKFNDTNQNAIQDPGEPAMSGWTIYLRVASNSTLRAVSVTNATGQYAFTGLPGKINYLAYEQLPSRWYATVNTSYNQNVTSNVTWNFANYYVPPSTYYNVGGIVFEDTNQNGVKDTNENVLPGWTVVLKNSAGAITSITTTNASGYYVFTGLSPLTTYYVEEALPVGWVNTTSLSVRIYIYNANNYSVNFGNKYSLPGNPPLYTLSGMKFNDTLVKNGIKDAGEQALSGWTIVVKSGTTIRYVAKTNSTGQYSFSGLTAGTYTVEEVMQSNWAATNSSSYTITLTGNTVVNFANFYSPSSRIFTIGGIKFNDSIAKNGIQDPGENPIAGWQMILRDSSLKIVATTSTNETGWYTFSTSAMKNNTVWYVEEVLPAGWVNTTPLIQQVTIINWDNYSISFGNWYNASGVTYYTITGMKYNDTDGNGQYNYAAGDRPIAGWTISYNGSDGVPYSVTTNSSGYYTITVLPGNYTIQEIMQPNWYNTTPRIVRVTITNSSVSGINFGNLYSPTMVPTYTISGYKFNDTNRNGVWDSGENPIANWSVLAINEKGEFLFTRTDANGFYAFSNLSSGNYNVEELMSEGWYNSTPRVRAITLQNASVTGVNFSNYYDSFILSGYVYFDYNSNKAYDAPDYPINGWTIELTNSTGGKVYATTNASGYYSLGNLRSGNYTVRAVMPTGWTNTTPYSLSFALSSNTRYDFGFRRAFYDGVYKTLTRNEWGTDASNYLRDYFTQVYSPAVEIGIPGTTGYSIQLTNITIVKDYLRNSVSSSALTNDRIDAQIYNAPMYPGGTFGANVLALQLNVDYSAKNILPFRQGFGNLVLYDYSALPSLNGKTINEILYISNRVLGGDTGTGYTIAGLEPLLVLLNDAFNDPDLTWANGHLF